MNPNQVQRVIQKLSFLEKPCLADIYLFKVNNESTKTKCETCSKLYIFKYHWRLTVVFIVNFGQISHIVLVFPSLLWINWPLLLTNSSISIPRKAKVKNQQCAKSVRIRSYSGSHFPTFGLNTKRYSICQNICQNFNFWLYCLGRK